MRCYLVFLNVFQNIFSSYQQYIDLKTLCDCIQSNVYQVGLNWNLTELRVSFGINQLVTVKLI